MIRSNETRPVTLVTGQWTDIPLEELSPRAAAWGYDGLELVCRGGYIDAGRAAADAGYCRQRLELLARHGLECFALSNHAAGHLVCDPNEDSRTDVLAPAACAGSAEKKRAWAIEAMKETARAAKNLGASVVTGFTGSPIWHLLYRFPPVPEAWIEAGFARFAELWNPILDVFDARGVRFALEVHPAQIAFDGPTRGGPSTRAGRPCGLRLQLRSCHLVWCWSIRSVFSTSFPTASITSTSRTRPCGRPEPPASWAPSAVWRPPPALGLPFAGPRRRRLRGDTPGAPPDRLPRTALGGMGRFGHESRARRPRRPGIYQAARRAAGCGCVRRRFRPFELRSQQE